MNPVGAMGQMVEDRPTAAFVLALLGAIFHLIAGGFVLLLATVTTVVGFTIFPPLAAGGLLVTLVVGIFIILAFLGAIWMYSGDRRRVSQGAVLTLLISILALPTLWGFIIGSLLGFIGAILGLVWQPTPPYRPAAVPLSPR